MTENALETIQIDEGAILNSLGLNPRDPKAQALILTCRRYSLDPILKHAVLIQGRLYVTRDGLLHVAHSSKQLDGIEVLAEQETPTHFMAKVAVYRKDMSHPFAYVGRYPKASSNKNYGPEMAIKCAEVMALRRAFDVSLAAREERWDVDDGEVVEAKEIESRSVGDRAVTGSARHPGEPVRSDDVAGSEGATSQGGPEEPSAGSDPTPSAGGEASTGATAPAAPHSEEEADRKDALLSLIEQAWDAELIRVGDVVRTASPRCLEMKVKVPAKKDEVRDLPVAVLEHVAEALKLEERIGAVA